MTRATEDSLSELHGVLAEKMKKRLAADDVSASDLNVIRQFLKDNGINSDGGRDPNLKDLSDDLPENIDNVHPLYGG